MAEYRRLGDYIREVNVRNRDLKVTNLLGLSVSKEFMPSIANTIGTDMSAYKIVERNQLVYIADTSRRGDKIAIGLLLCSEGNTEHIELMMLNEDRIKVAQYLTCLPDKQWFVDKLNRSILIAKEYSENKKQED